MLELTLVERAAEEPLMGFYARAPLHPGAWSSLLENAGLPQTMRRLTEPLVVAGRPRATELRCLPMLPALAWLLAEERPPESASVRAWRLGARLVEAMARAGGRLPDISRFAAAFPPTAHACLMPMVDVGEETPTGITAQEAVAEFVAAATRALAAAVAEPRRLANPDAHADVIDLAVLQPALRAVAPDVGAAPPVVKLRDTLEPLALTLSLPVGDDSWALHVDPPEPGLAARAARIFQPLAALREGTVTLTLEQVAELRLAAPALEFAGARVHVPPEIADAGQLELEDAEITLGPAGDGAGLGSLVAYDVRAALGGREASEEEFRALAAATQPLVRLGGQWRVLDQAALRRARALATLALHGQALPALSALGAALAGRTDLRGLEFDVDVAVGSGLAELVERLRGPALREPLETAPEFRGELRPYQHVGLGWLVRMRELGLGACLADDMGLGKTVQLIAYLLDRSDGVDGPALIVCPTSVLGNWERELARFAPGLSVRVHHGPDRAGTADALRGDDVIVTSYALLPRDRVMLGRIEWRTVVLDEAQAIKNPLTRSAQAARALPARHRVAMTGTPIENRLEELWSIIQFLNPGLLDTRTAFRRRYATPIERRGDEDAAARLAGVTMPFILRRHKTDPDVLPDLPPRLEYTEHCTLTLEQAALYQATLDAMLGRVRGTAGIERRAQVLTLLTRLKQVCNHPAQALGAGGGGLAGRSGKLDRLTEMLEEVLDEGESALVFTQYAVMAGLLADHLTDTLATERLLLDGSTPRPMRDRLVARFQEGGGPPRVLVMSLRAGGLGLNLTNATHVFHFDRWWNPAVEDQASDRAHRIGQTRVVEVHRLICAGTVEERIDEIIEGKRELARRIVDRGAETAISELSDDELTDLVGLRG